MRYKVRPTEVALIVSIQTNQLLIEQIHYGTLWLKKRFIITTEEAYFWCIFLINTKLKCIALFSIFLQLIDKESGSQWVEATCGKRAFRWEMREEPVTALSWTSASKEL